MSGNLSGHTDHSEDNLTAPLLSISLGQSAVFLLGGQTLKEIPNALLLRGGDVMIMTKEARLAYHGVPRILPTPTTWHGDEGEYLNSHRININIRQVH